MSRRHLSSPSAGLRPAPGSHGAPDRRARRRRGAARRDAAVRRELAADDASASAVRQVPLDWQGPVTSYAKDQQAAAGGRAASRASPTRPRAATAPFARPSTAPAGISTQTSQGAVLAVPPRLPGAHPHLPLPARSLRPGGVVLDQQMAATLQARIGDTVRLRARPDAPPQRYRSAASRWSPPRTWSSSRSTRCSARRPRSRPQNVAIMLTGTFARTLAPQLADDRHRRVGRERPARRSDRRPVAGAGAGRPGPLDGRQPARALKRADPDPQPRRALAARPGAVRRQPLRPLNTAAGDALYAETLYIMLAVPGALVALGLAYLAALGTSSATGATWRCCAPAAPARATCSCSPASRASIDRPRRRAARRRARVRGRPAPGQRRRTAHRLARGRHRCSRRSALGIAGAAAARLGGRRAALRREVTEGAQRGHARPRAALAAASTSTSSRWRSAG